MSRRLEFLKYQKNRLIDQYQSKSYESEAKILVSIMDIEDEIAEEMQALRKKA